MTKYWIQRHTFILAKMEVWLDRCMCHVECSCHISPQTSIFKPRKSGQIVFVGNKEILSWVNALVLFLYKRCISSVSV